MPFTAIKLKKIKSSQDESGLREIRIFRVYCDDLALTPTDAMYASVGTGTSMVSVPAYLQSHPTRPGLSVSSVESDFTPETQMTFDVVVTYGVLQGTWTEPKPTGTNVRWNKRIEVSGEPATVLVNHTHYGTICRTSAGKMFEADFPKELYDEIIVVQFSTDSVPADAISACRGRLNRSTINFKLVRNGYTYMRTFPPRTLKGGNITYQYDLTDPSGGAWVINAPLIYRSTKNPNNGDEIGWAFVVLDQGKFVRPAAGQPAVNVQQLTALKSDGTALPDTDDTNKHFLTFDILDDANTDMETDQFLAMLSGFTA